MSLAVEQFVDQIGPLWLPSDPLDLARQGAVFRYAADGVTGDIQLAVRIRLGKQQVRRSEGPEEDRKQAAGNVRAQWRRQHLRRGVTQFGGQRSGIQHVHASGTAKPGASPLHVGTHRFSASREAENHAIYAHPFRGMRHEAKNQLSNDGALCRRFEVGHAHLPDSQPWGFGQAPPVLVKEAHGVPRPLRRGHPHLVGPGQPAIGHFSPDLLDARVTPIEIDHVRGQQSENLRNDGPRRPQRTNQQSALGFPFQLFPHRLPPRFVGSCSVVRVTLCGWLPTVQENPPSRGASRCTLAGRAIDLDKLGQTKRFPFLLVGRAAVQQCDTPRGNP